MSILVDKEKIVLNERELFIRLGHCPAESVDILSTCIAEFEKAVSYRFCYMPAVINVTDDKKLNLGFGEIKSDSLSRNLNGCSKAYVFAATLGIEVDRHLRKLSIVSPAKQFVTDAVASSAVEALCDYAEAYICGDLPHKPRFSPGYGDLPLNIQPRLLQFLNAEKQLGITLTDALLMMPSKSVTAIVGVKNNDNQ